jgi:hypothetical protein
MKLQLGLLHLAGRPATGADLVRMLGEFKRRYPPPKNIARPQSLTCVEFAETRWAI